MLYGEEDRCGAVRVSGGQCDIGRGVIAFNLRIELFEKADNGVGLLAAVGQKLVLFRLSRAGTVCPSRVR